MDLPGNDVYCHYYAPTDQQKVLEDLDAARTVILVNYLNRISSLVLQVYVRRFDPE